MTWVVSKVSEEDFYAGSTKLTAFTTFRSGSCLTKMDELIARGNNKLTILQASKLAQPQCGFWCVQSGLKHRGINNHGGGQLF